MPESVQQPDGKLPLIACETCAAIYRRQTLQHGETANCPRCGNVLWRYTRLTPANWLALAITALIVFCIANAYPIASMSVQGRTQYASLVDALIITWNQGWAAVALMCGLTAFALPLLEILLLIWLLGALARGQLAPGHAALARLLGLLRPWCMIPVFVLAIVVAVVKLAGMAAVSPGAGLAGFGILTVLMTMLGRVSPPMLWRMAEAAGAAHIHPEPERGAPPTGCHACGLVQPVDRETHTAQHCRRCDTTLHWRKPDDVSRTWALLIAAALLYIPANLLPVMAVASVLGASTHTILGGVIQLWAMGSWDLALIVFIASVAVPMTKLLALAVLLVQQSRRSANSLAQRTRLYRAVEFIGQWSMLDVYVVILLAAIADFPGLMSVTPGAGATAFGLVVVLTMLAAMSFDPRKAWDEAGARAPRGASDAPPALAQDARSQSGNS